MDQQRPSIVLQAKCYFLEGNAMRCGLIKGSQATELFSNEVFDTICTLLMHRYFLVHNDLRLLQNTSKQMLF